MYRDLASLYSALGEKTLAKLTLERALEVTQQEPVGLSLLLQFASVLRQTGGKSPGSSN